MKKWGLISRLFFNRVFLENWLEGLFCLIIGIEISSLIPLYAWKFPEMRYSSAGVPCPLGHCRYFFGITCQKDFPRDPFDKRMQGWLALIFFPNNSCIGLT